jgi:hypothetical protein
MGLVCGTRARNDKYSRSFDDKSSREETIREAKE